MTEKTNQVLNFCCDGSFPKISIVTPCFNSDKYLEETILSVLGQNYPNLEYIIIDGGSTDKTVEIIKKYQAKLSFWISEKDSGMYDAIQKGFNKSTGEIMAYINSDDIYHKKSFYIVSEIFSKNSEIKWLSGATTHIDEYGRGVNCAESRKFTRFDFLSGDFQWIQQESCFFRRELYDKAGGYIDVSLRFAGDFELWIRFFRYERLYVANTLIGAFRVRSSNQLSLDNMDKYLSEVDRVLKKEQVGNSDKLKLIRYKIITAVLNFFYKVIEKLLRKYRQIETGTPNMSNIRFNRSVQGFELE
ncbi:MAG: glycosyltransferase [Chitinivibrionia bacterium]|nr:glycosyltransferase [Chitinivibrionia bacterium]